MPDNTLYVGRPTRLGNPYILGQHCEVNGVGEFFVWTSEQAVELYRRLIIRRLLNDWYGEDWAYLIETIKGKNLACWCPLDQPCHADVLLEIANEIK